MGTPIIPPVDPDPVPPGVFCSRCWGNDKKLGDGPTPSSVTATFSGIEKGPGWSAGMGEPLDGDYILIQRPIMPCVFRFLDDPSYVTWDCAGVYVEVFGVNSEGSTVFYGVNGLCDLFIANIQFHRFKNGSCLITIPEIEE